MKDKSIDRFRWALDVMKIKPTHHIFEIGCGSGIAVELIASKLKEGTITAIDQSQPMIEKAIKRNNESLKNGSVKFIKSSLNQYVSNHEKFNTIFCFNVNLFWTKKILTEEAQIIKTNLLTNGLFYIFYGPLFANGYAKIVDPVKKNVIQQKFKIVDFIHETKMQCCCFILKQ